MKLDSKKGQTADKRPDDLLLKLLTVPGSYGRELCNNDYR